MDKKLKMIINNCDYNRKSMRLSTPHDLIERHLGYNAALDDIIDFINMLQDGKVDDSFIESLLDKDK